MNNMQRPSWDEFFMMVAILAGTRTSCLKRGVGAIIVVDKRIVATGYNGAAAGVRTCLELGHCYYEFEAKKHYSQQGGKLEDIKGRYKIYCQAIHAEENAIAQAAKLGIKIAGGSLYVTNLPCPRCAKLAVQSGIKEIFVWKEYLSNSALSLDDKRASEHVFLSAKIKIQWVAIEKDRINEISELMKVVGERNSYSFI